MPLPTSDFRNPVCMEMKILRNARAENQGGPMEMGSVDSSDTYASCNTQPFNSQGDLTEDITEPDQLDNSNLYVNPMESPRSIVKKSASGDTALRSLGASPLEETYKGFGPPERGSRGSLNDTPIPKHRKTRFQQVMNIITNFFLHYHCYLLFAIEIFRLKYNHLLHITKNIKKQAAPVGFDKFHSKFVC